MGIYVENAWTDFHPTHRYMVGSPFGGLRRIDEPIVQPFRGEDPAFTGGPAALKTRRSRCCPA